MLRRSSLRATQVRRRSARCDARARARSRPAATTLHCAPGRPRQLRRRASTDDVVEDVARDWPIPRWPGPANRALAGTLGRQPRETSRETFQPVPAVRGVPYLQEAVPETAKLGQVERPEHAARKVEGLVDQLVRGGSSPLRRMKSPCLSGFSPFRRRLRDGALEAILPRLSLVRCLAVEVCKRPSAWPKTRCHRGFSWRAPGRAPLVAKPMRHVVRHSRSSQPSHRTHIAARIASA